MAILAACNHSVFSLGTFGFWASYLAGGEVVYPDIIIKKPNPFTTVFYKESRLANFTGIKTNEWNKQCTQNLSHHFFLNKIIYFN